MEPSPPVLGRQSPGGPPEEGTRIVFVPFHSPQGRWLIAPALGGAVSFLSIRPGAQGGWGGSENPAEAPRPSPPTHSHQCRPCLASQVVLGGRGGLEVPLSEMEKCHQAAASPPSPAGGGGVPPGWRRARACPGPWQCPLPPRLGGRGCVGAEPRKQQRPHCISLVETQRWHRTLPGEEGQAPRASPRCPGVHGG